MHNFSRAAMHVCSARKALLKLDFQYMRASIYTLGCRLNQADSALLAGDLESHGYKLVPWGQTADVLVINSCAVTG